MVFSTYKKVWIVFFHRKGLKAPEIGKRLLQEGMMASIHEFIKRFESVTRKWAMIQSDGSGKSYRR